MDRPTLPLERIVPALLTALGVMILAAGLLAWTGPPPEPSGIPAPTTITAGRPSPSPSARLTLPPLGTPSAGSSAPTPFVVGPSESRVATRVRVPALSIDLPVVPPNDGYPLCDVAQYMEILGQPGGGRATYLYGHAREGMFLPLLEASQVRNGRAMLGMVVEVYTNDDLRFLYEIAEVRRHQTRLDPALAVDTEEVWLQTSEGPRGTIPKTQVVARFLSVERAAPGEAHPSPRPVACG